MIGKKYILVLVLVLVVFATVAMGQGIRCELYIISQQSDLTTVFFSLVDEGVDNPSNGVHELGGNGVGGLVRGSLVASQSNSQEV